MIHLKHSSGAIKECPTGFSFTTLCFGFFVPAFRGDVKWAAILLVSCIVAGCIYEPLSLCVTAFFASMYNKQFIKEQLEKGYEPADEASAAWLQFNMQ